MAKPPSVKIIKVGTICQETSEIGSTYNLQLKAELGIGGGSTVTLIEADQRILVDTGFDFEWIDTAVNNNQNTSRLTRALKEQKVNPDDINIVFLTHWHRDHFGNLGIFKKARCMASKMLVTRLGLSQFIGVGDGEDIVPGVKVLYTPGHTSDHASILVETKISGLKARIAIAGDAVISHSYFQTGRIWKNNADFYNADEAKKSIQRIIVLSDVIIPGHGDPFMTFRPPWMETEE